ncbi:hypothetical protein TIFTF001_021922 [Ficus carica]|uniref:Wall-associated receptor kinase galacturonan-binding domain-containing protein n=1 Tax=Ficus carica TaxID=3494 RepID=A0AA88AID4_FICCA|nr:hypothetical protein TIFTF001_021922 [Ficus carica]
MEAPRNTPLLVLIITIMLPRITSPSFAQDDYHNNSFPPSSCGNIHNISYPFRLDTDPFQFGSETPRWFYYVYELSCNNNLLVLKNNVVLQAINYDNYTIRVVDYNIHNNTHNCSAIPQFSYEYSGLETKIRFGHVGEQWRKEGEWRNVRHLTETVLFLSCEKPVQNSSYIPTAPCINSSILSQYSNYFAESRSQYSYMVYGTGFRLSDLEDSCLVYNQAFIKRDRNHKNITSYMDVYKEFVHGFELSWVQSFDQSGERLCYVDEDSNKVHCLSEPHRTRSVVIALDHAGLVGRLGKILHKAI